MAERAFVIKRSFLFPEELDVSKCDIEDGINGDWTITSNGWVSGPEDLGMIVGLDVDSKDTCVFKFESSVPEYSREYFYKGLNRILAAKKT